MICANAVDGKPEVFDKVLPSPPPNPVRLIQSVAARQLKPHGSVTRGTVLTDHET
ncbi:hypothetical protein PSE10B_27230 [Pseudomonas amygdali pv. eriobotryae]|nr:hypothetical protein PSE10B_27230 [Pseudomonas amygdali pv. eriobotryae]